MEGIMKIKSILLLTLALMAGSAQANWFSNCCEKSMNWIGANPKASIIVATSVVVLGLYLYFDKKDKPRDSGMDRFTGNEPSNDNPSGLSSPSSNQIKVGSFLKQVSSS